MKILMRLLLVLVLVCGCMVLTVSADETEVAPVTETETETETDDGTLTTSDECIAMIKQMEGFCRYPMWDYAQWTVGYGTRCPDDMLSYYKANGITEAQAENLLRNFLDKFEREIRTQMIEKRGLNLSQQQFDALVSFSYNCGTGWMYSTTGTFYKAIVEGHTGNDLVRAFALWCSAGDEVQLFLIRRRLSEANMYLNGIYDQKPPSQYCYVLYNANGGTTSPRTQGYSTEWYAAPYPVPTYEGYTFLGWYTQRTGGTKVTSLNASHNGTTLYAHWVDANGNNPNTTKGPWDVTVTNNGVNLRKGPGTNYSKVGTANKGDKMTIVETVDAGGYTWGNYGDGWIALRYTDFDQIVDGGGTTTPAPSVPETTTPEKLTGTIKVNFTLNVRENAGTNYKVVGELTKGQKVEILETKMVGPTKWGRISLGWISMDYVVLDGEESKPETKPETTPEQKPETDTTVTTYTGTIYNCAICVNVRSGPDVTYDLVGTAKKDAKVTITEIKGNWCNTNLGWISLTYVKLDQEIEEEEPEQDQQPEQTPETETTYTGTIYNCVTSVNVRSGPAVSYDLVGTAKKGTKVTITEMKDGWCKTDLGWISLTYVKLDETTTQPEIKPETKPETKPEEQPSTTPQVVWGTINVNISLNIRKEPSVDSALVGTYGKNERVKITERKTAAGMVWGKTDRGWISMYYVVLDDYSAEINKTYTVIADRLNVRSGAGTDKSIVSYVDNGAKVTVLEIVTNDEGQRWARISTGWVSMDYLQ